MKGKYKVLTITPDSDHEAASSMEDDYMMIVQHESGEWWIVDDFFYSVDITNFEV